MPNHGRGGRPPKPTHLKILEGNPGKRDLPENEPQPDKGIPDSPPTFTEAQRQAFETLGLQLDQVGVLTKLDGPALSLAALAYTQTMASAEHVAKHGPVWINFAGCRDKDGNIVALPDTKVNPHWKIQVEAMKRLQAMLQEFGMTPSSRTKVQVTKEKEPESGKRRFFTG